MRKSDFYYNSQSQSWTKCFTLITFVIFCFTVTTFSVFQISNFYSDKETVRDILMDNFKGFEAAESLKNIDSKYEQQKAQEDLLNSLNSERQARAAAENQTVSAAQTSNFYYEEQKPVVVYSKTDIESPIARQEMAEITPKQDTNDDYPYSKAFDDGYEDRDEDYFGQTETKQTPSSPYYSQQREQQESSEQPYYRQPQSYYDDSSEDFSNSQEARANEYHDSNNYYKRYPYAKPPPTTLAAMGNAKRLSAVNKAEIRRMQMPPKNQAQQQQYRNPFPSYMDDYEYQSPSVQSPAAIPFSYQNRKTPPQGPQYRTRSTPSPAKEKPETEQQMDFLTMFKSIKTMWDLYQSFTSSWNTIAERRNREEELARQKYKQQQQIRINSRKPPKFNARRNTTTTNKGTRKEAITNATTTTIAPTALELYAPAKDEAETANNKQPLAKSEPRKGLKAKAKSEAGVRDRRQAADGSKEAASVGEGRYIKGDPLKGYYDFVITEGSYKFWAVFQVGTAILIIYSTFAAIYYSKVNPLVSDYDYTDYLGGARSLSEAGDLDFIDDADEEPAATKAKTKSWSDWLPRTGHSLKFILEAIDKLPNDHAEDHGKESARYKTGGEVQTHESAEYPEDKAEQDVNATNSNEGEPLNASEEFAENNYSSMKQDQEEM